MTDEPIPLDARARKFHKPYRSREEIISSMLEAARDSSYCTSTEMAYRSRFPYMYSREYLHIIIDSGLVVGRPKSKQSPQIIYYDITEKGTRFLSLWYQMRESLSLSD